MSQKQKIDYLIEINGECSKILNDLTDIYYKNQCKIKECLTYINNLKDTNSHNLQQIILMKDEINKNNKEVELLRSNLKN